MRASEQITSETTFLRLFGAGVLELLADRTALETNQIFRSAPGGGKTSLLRVFSASSLLALHVNRSQVDYRDLYAGVSALGAVDDSGPKLLGIVVPCSKNYATLEDLPLESARSQRLFRALLDCRIVLSALRGAMILKRREYPKDLTSLELNLDADLAREVRLPTECSGLQAYEWAKDIESRIAQSLDSLDPSPPTDLGHSRLVSLDILRPPALQYEGEDLVPRVLVMFDDVHRLAPAQRAMLGRWLTDERPPVPTWLAERLEALNPDELLDQGARHGRDFEEPSPTLERFWRNRPVRFEQALSTIAEKRCREARSVDIAALEDCLDTTIEIPNGDDAARRIKERIVSSVGRTAQFEEWIEATKSKPKGSPFDEAVKWRTLEILIQRVRGKQQLAFDLPLPAGELSRKDDSAVRAAAEIFLSAEFGWPYYYGFHRLSYLASSNIDQFLAISAELFEEASAAAILDRSTMLSPDRQHSIIKRVAKDWWEDHVLVGLPLRSDVRRFIESIGRFAQLETNQLNAPYPPGVTGVSITMAERELLMDEHYLESRPDLRKLRAVISTCLAHNILEADLDRSQNYERRMLLYLNRLLCAHFDLPLQYGSWRAKRPDDLAKWMTVGFKAPGSGRRQLA